MTTDGRDLPRGVAAAHERADAEGFALSCAPGFGRFLAALAAAVPPGGRILELGTGCGAGTAWTVSGLGPRTDVTVVTVDLDAERSRRTEAAGWPPYVRFEVGDGAEFVRQAAGFDLVFADAPGGKTEGLDHTVAALAPGGILVVDDMDLGLHADPALRAALASVRTSLLADPRLVSAEVPVATGALIATRSA